MSKIEKFEKNCTTIYSTVYEDNAISQLTAEGDKGLINCIQLIKEKTQNFKNDSVIQKITYIIFCLLLEQSAGNNVSITTNEYQENNDLRESFLLERYETGLKPEVKAIIYTKLLFHIFLQVSNFELSNFDSQLFKKNYIDNIKAKFISWLKEKCNSFNIIDHIVDNKLNNLAKNIKWNELYVRKHDETLLLYAAGSNVALYKYHIPTRINNFFSPTSYLFDQLSDLIDYVYNQLSIGLASVFQYENYNQNIIKLIKKNDETYCSPDYISKKTRKWLSDQCGTDVSRLLNFNYEIQFARDPMKKLASNNIQLITYNHDNGLEIKYKQSTNNNNLFSTKEKNMLVIALNQYHFSLLSSVMTDFNRVQDYYAFKIFIDEYNSQIRINTIQDCYGSEESITKGDGAPILRIRFDLLINLIPEGLDSEDYFTNSENEKAIKSYSVVRCSIEDTPMKLKNML